MSQNNFEEIECKFLDVNPKEIEAKLKELGAQREFKRLFRRRTFDFPDKRLAAQKGWLRLRDEGNRITLTYKQRLGVSEGKPDSGMREVEIVVNDFEHAGELVTAMGMEEKFYEENWRTQYRLGDVEVCIDEWPLIPPYVEIEGHSWEAVEDTAKKLGFDFSKRLVCSTMQVYEHYDIDENEYQVLTFDKQEKKKPA